VINRQKHISAFWQQLQETIEQLLKSQQEHHFDADSLLRDYHNTLGKIDRNITFHFERDEEEGPVEMIFGCDGYPESIGSVLSLVGAAPELSGISFKAFNNRYDPVPSYINMGEEVCEIKDFWFSLKDVAGRLRLTVYLKDVPKVLDADPRTEAVMILLDALIGEYELMTKISALDWVELPADPRDFSLRPLKELREQFDEMKDSVRSIGLTVH